MTPARGYALLFWGSAVFALGCVAYAWWQLPSGRIPIHFGANGEPDGWGTRTELVGVLAGVTGLLALFMGWLAARIDRLSWEMVNIPHKEYWGREENRPRALARGREDLHLVGAWTMWLMALVALMVHRSVTQALETGASGNVEIGLVIASSALLVVGVLWRQRWYRQHPEA